MKQAIRDWAWYSFATAIVGIVHWCLGSDLEVNLFHLSLGALITSVLFICIRYIVKLFEDA